MLSLQQLSPFWSLFIHIDDSMRHTDLVLSGLGSCACKANKFISADHLCQGVFGAYRLARCRHHLLELSFLNHIDDNIDTANEFTFDEDLRESWPIRVEFEPLADSLILQDVEGLDVAVLQWLQVEH